jgi:hypothetical protein
MARMKLSTTTHALLHAAYSTSQGNTITALTPSILADAAGLDPDTVRIAADWLCDHGLLRGARSFGGELLLTSITEEGARLIENGEYAV